MKCKRIFGLVFTLALFAAVARGQSAATVTIQANQPGAVVSSNLFGIFFEEINCGGEGGLYAEMVRNRAFYDTAGSYWTLVTQGSTTGSMSVDTNKPLNTNMPNSLKLTMASGTGSVGAGNSGFWGMALTAGAAYNLNFYACATNSFSGSIGARLESADGSTVYAQTSLGGLTANWQKFSASLVSSGTDTNARLVMSISQPGTVWLDVVSLFPQATFNNRPNGLRLDLANMLAALHPSFFRFPGGNFIESYNVTNAVRWKKTIGDIAQRPGHNNDSWGYWSTDGFGLMEFYQFCEDLGMTPLYDINAGLMLGYNGSTNNTVPMSQMGPWVQDAVDLIQFATGDTGTTWGAQRAALGHPALLPMSVMEIGNENGGSYYDARYPLFYDAIKSNSPNVKLISPVWGSPSSPTSRPVEIRDEHYYASASTFISYATKYDSYSRSGPKVFIGEYAVAYAIPPNTFPATLGNALGEAAFMTGVERNSDVVLMASYAPMLCNVNYPNWYPNMIYYDNARAYGTPSYYVQKMFSESRGDCVLPNSIAVTTNAVVPPPRGTIGLGSWSTAVQYTNIVVTSNGVTLYQSDFVGQGTNGWRVYAGDWSTNNGVYQQANTATMPAYSTDMNGGSTNWANYTISLRARKVSGSEGFLILFNWTDDNNWTWWNVGGWGNTKDAIEQMSGGTKTTLASVSQTALVNNTWYDISIVVSNYTMQCYLNGTLMQTVTYSSNATASIYASTTYNTSAGQVIVKAVNPYNLPVATTFNLTGVNAIAPNATVVQLTSGSSSDQNSLATPIYVSPVTNSISNAGTNFTLTLPANSLSVLKLTASGINTYTNLSLQFTSPISIGQTVASTVWGQMSGNWINLTANANHAIAWSSANTNIATVDMTGNITGVGSGITSIVATYASLGLAATQTVQVTNVPATLVHRYSFSEASGTTTADSVGGLAWNGTLPRGGTFSGSGQLLLASNLQQFVQLPAGILSNYTAVTIDAWASFGTLPGNCFFFGFGNTNGASGTNYIFCQPLNGRIAITAGNYAGEQNSLPNAGSWSGLANEHITAVFNPPLGYLALYTNGVLAAVNNAVTVPFTSVNAVVNYIGRSLYSGDSYFSASLDEFRIYNGPLSAAAIAASQALGAGQGLNASSPVISLVAGGGGLTLSWPLAAPDFTVMTTTNLAGGSWAPVAMTPQIVGGQWQAVLPAAGNVQQFYQLQK